MWHLLQLKLEDLPPARELFSRALELDPMLAAAHTGLAILLIQEGLVYTPRVRPSNQQTGE
jgi:hypothetical protein